MFYVKEEIRVELVELAIDTGNPLETVNCTLYTSPVTPSEAQTLATMLALAASWTGSTPKVVTWTGPNISPGRQPYVQSQNLHWVCSSAPASPVSNYGVYYDDGARLLGIDPFPAPIVVDEVLDPVDWICTFP